jgi:hypothetical protein
MANSTPAARFVFGAGVDAQLASGRAYDENAGHRQSDYQRLGFLGGEGRDSNPRMAFTTAASKLTAALTNGDLSGV